MKQRYHSFRRENGIYYFLDTLTKKRNSLKTADPKEARRLLNALNEACQQPAVNLQIAQVYLQHSDPEFVKRTWQHVMDEMGRTKSGNTKKRWDVAIKDKAFDLILICRSSKPKRNIFLTRSTKARFRRTCFCGAFKISPST